MRDSESVWVLGAMYHRHPTILLGTSLACTAECKLFTETNDREGWGRWQLKLELPSTSLVYLASGRDNNSHWLLITIFVVSKSRREW
jgi:hypothetical protein